MYESAGRKKWSNKDLPPETVKRRNGTERRQEPSSGFTYISTVGWICRREQFRRKDDSDKSTNETSV
jgi:hypothetical protein